MKHFVKFLTEQYEKQAQVDEFVKFAAEYLNLPVPKVILLDKREENMTTASYNLGNREIKVYIKGSMSDSRRRILPAGIPNIILKRRQK